VEDQSNGLASVQPQGIRRGIGRSVMKKNTRYVFSAAFVGLAFSGVLNFISTAGATVIADWTFETSQPATAGPFSPEIGAGSASGSHVGVSTYSTPAGNGSSHSFSSNTWSVGDYYQFQVNTTGLSGIQLIFDQTSSNTGPRDFQLEYSTNGSSFTNFGSPYSVLANAAPNPAWNATTSSSIYTFTDDLSSVAALNNAPTVYFRLANSSTVSANGGTVATAGTDRVDNVIVQTSVPEPMSAGILTVGAFGLLSRRRKC
jgi:hypothetical protein